MPFDLPQKAHKEYTLYVRAPAQEGENSSSTTLEVSAISGPRVLNHQRVPVKFITGSTLVISAGGESGLAAADSEKPFMLSENEHKTLISDVAQQDLPHQWSGYEPADLVVINGQTWQGMDDDQQRALRMWVEQGGHAVLCGENSTEWRKPDGQALAGVVPQDLQSLRRLECVEAWGGEPYAAEAGGLLTVSGPLNPGASALFSEGGRPLVVQRTVLRGHVLWLGFDPFRQTVRGWRGYNGFWKHALEAAGAAATALPRLPAPPLGAVIGFGVVYALIFGPLNIWVLRRMRRTVRSWLFMPSLALGMTLVVLVIGQSWGSGRTVLNSLSVLQAANGGRTAYEDTLTGIFSPTNRAFDLSMDDPAPRLQDQSSDAGEGGVNLDWPAHQADAGVKWDGVALSLFSTRVLQEWRPRDLAGSIRVLLDTRDSGTVQNDTGYTLRGAYLFYRGRYSWIGEMAPRSTHTVRAQDWDPSLKGELPRPAAAGQLLENDKFRESVRKLCGGAKDLLLADQGRRDAWLIAEVADYHGGLQVQAVPYNNHAALLLLRDPRR
jgi:hypothetical protein